MNKIKLYLSSLVIAFSMLVAPLAVVGVTSAAYDPALGACNGANGEPVASGGGCPSGDSENSLPSVVAKIINIFSWVVGAVSVIMIIYGGFKYITSGGDSNGVTAAKNTILYALIGLVIVALSQIIVNFVLNKSIDAVSSIFTLL